MLPWTFLATDVAMFYQISYLETTKTLFFFKSATLAMVIEARGCAAFQE